MSLIEMQRALSASKPVLDSDFADRTRKVVCGLDDNTTLHALYPVNVKKKNINRDAPEKWNEFYYGLTPDQKKQIAFVIRGLANPNPGLTLDELRRDISEHDEGSIPQRCLGGLQALFALEVFATCPE